MTGAGVPGVGMFIHATSVTFVAPFGAKHGMLTDSQPVTAVQRHADGFPRSMETGGVVHWPILTDRTGKLGASSSGASHGSNVATVVVVVVGADAVVVWLSDSSLGVRVAGVVWNAPAAAAPATPAPIATAMATASRRLLIASPFRKSVRPSREAHLFYVRQLPLAPITATVLRVIPDKRMLGRPADHTYDTGVGTFTLRLDRARSRVQAGSRDDGAARAKGLVCRFGGARQVPLLGWEPVERGL